VASSRSVSSRLHRPPQRDAPTYEFGEAVAIDGHEADVSDPQADKSAGTAFVYLGNPL
jgi:hypothetical protein